MTKRQWLMLNAGLAALRANLEVWDRDADGPYPSDDEFDELAADVLGPLHAEIVRAPTAADGSAVPSGPGREVRRSATPDPEAGRDQVVAGIAEYLRSVGLSGPCRKQPSTRFVPNGWAVVNLFGVTIADFDKEAAADQLVKLLADDPGR